MEKELKAVEKEVEVAYAATHVVSRTCKLKYPTEPKYYRQVDEGRFFPRGTILFAMLPKRGGKSFMLVEVEKGKQDYTDFIPEQDCRSEFWLKTTGLRKTAFDLLSKSYHLWEEISQEEFLRERTALLDVLSDFITVE